MTDSSPLSTPHREGSPFHHLFFFFFFSIQVARDTSSYQIIGFWSCNIALWVDVWDISLLFNDYGTLARFCCGSVTTSGGTSELQRNCPPSDAENQRMIPTLKGQCEWGKGFNSSYTAQALLPEGKYSFMLNETKLTSLF